MLGALAQRGEPLRAELGEGLAFVSRVKFVDPQRAYFLLEAGGSESAEAALLGRPRASFRALAGGVHVEFAASGPTRALHAGAPVIRMKFPDILATIQRRDSERREVNPPAPLHCVADAAGVISFDGYMVDISESGIGMVQYAPNITLEPGTVLRGCRIELPDGTQVTVDLEVRYSRPASLPDGRQALRSGCRFVAQTLEARQQLAAHFRR